MSHKVSVIIPVRNMARFLPDAVASIPDVDEILIAVAASDDDTLQVARELARRRAGVVVLDNPKTTPAAGRNAGLSPRARRRHRLQRRRRRLAARQARQAAGSPRS